MDLITSCNRGHRRTNPREKERSFAKHSYSFSYPLYTASSQMTGQHLTIPSRSRDLDMHAVISNLHEIPLRLQMRTRFPLRHTISLPSLLVRILTQISSQLLQNTQTLANCNVSKLLLTFLYIRIRRLCWVHRYTDSSTSSTGKETSKWPWPYKPS